MQALKRAPRHSVLCLWYLRGRLVLCSWEPASEEAGSAILSACHPSRLTSSFHLTCPSGSFQSRHPQTFALSSGSPLACFMRSRTRKPAYYVLNFNSATAHLISFTLAEWARHSCRGSYLKQIEREQPVILKPGVFPRWVLPPTFTDICLARSMLASAMDKVRNQI